MSDSNDFFNRIPLKRGDNILEVLFIHCQSDDDQIEAEFYRINPLVCTQHIQTDGLYYIPSMLTDDDVNTEVGLLVWE